MGAWRAWTRLVTSAATTKTGIRRVAWPLCEIIEGCPNLGRFTRLVIFPKCLKVKIDTRSLFRWIPWQLDRSLGEIANRDVGVLYVSWEVTESRRIRSSRMDDAPEGSAGTTKNIFPMGPRTILAPACA
jgi:hypothetical protein